MAASGKMWERTIFLVVCIHIVTSAKRADFRDSGEELQEKIVSFKKNTSGAYSPMASRLIKADAVVVEKFVQTLISSERYLKMIDLVYRKLDHLDGTFHDRTNSIMTYLSEIRNINSGPISKLEIALVSLKKLLDLLEQIIAEQCDNPHLRGRSHSL